MKKIISIYILFQHFDIAFPHFGPFLNNEKEKEVKLISIFKINVVNFIKNNL